MLAAITASCSGLMRDRRVADDGSGKVDTLPQIENGTYLTDIDDYVSFVKSNGEQMEFIHSRVGSSKKVISLLNSDTVRVSLISDSLAKGEVDIYYKYSQPLLLEREVFLDVDSNYLETAYFKDDKVFKCYRDGIELQSADSINLFGSILATAK